MANQHFFADRDTGFDVTGLVFARKSLKTGGTGGSQMHAK
jgi:hypothetical protein